MDVDARANELRVSLGDRDFRLSRAEALALRAELGEALTGRETFARTVGHRREDGSYAVERRNADSAGHRKVFDSFEDLASLYRELPRRFEAADLSRPGLTGGRRHLLLWHFVEHPAFECTLAARQPLTARKGAEGGRT